MRLRGQSPRRLLKFMAASAAMIVVGFGSAVACAQDALPPASQAPSNGVQLVNRISNLESQVQQLTGQIEVLQHQLQQQQQTSKEQYIDLDSRLSKLEHAQAAPAASAATVAAAPAATPAAPAAAAMAKAAPMTAAEKVESQKAYEASFKALRGGNYVASAKGFRAFIDKYPNSPLVANAYYWLGGSYYVTQNYKPALDAFQTLLKQYPKSGKAPDAQLRVADCLIGLKNYVAARAVLEAVIKAHPRTALERRAHDKLVALPAVNPKSK